VDGERLPAGERDFGDASRRTYLAAERTFLAWFRSGLAALAVSVGVGRLLPDLVDADAAPFVTIGVGFALLGLFMVVFGAARQRAVRRALEGGRFAPLPDAIVIGMGVAGVALAAGTIAVVTAAL
jgi:putative membrane protein